MANISRLILKICACSARTSHSITSWFLRLPLVDALRNQFDRPSKKNDGYHSCCAELSLGRVSYCPAMKNLWMWRIIVLSAHGLSFQTPTRRAGGKSKKNCFLAPMCTVGITFKDWHDLQGRIQSIVQEARWLILLYKGIDTETDGWDGS